MTDHRVVDPPRWLQFTWTSDDTARQPSLVTVVLEPQGGQTRLTLIHEDLPDDRVASHDGGWASIIDNLRALLAEASR